MPSETLRYDHGEGQTPEVDDVVMWRRDTRRGDPVFRVGAVFPEGLIAVKDITDADHAFIVHPGNMVLIGVAARDVE